MAIRAVLFDLGGVLENEIETGMDAKWEARLGLRSGGINARLFDSGLAIVKDNMQAIADVRACLENM